MYLWLEENSLSKLDYQSQVWIDNIKTYTHYCIETSLTCSHWHPWTTSLPAFCSLWPCPQKHVYHPSDPAIQYKTQNSPETMMHHLLPTPTAWSTERQTIITRLLLRTRGPLGSNLLCRMKAAVMLASDGENNDILNTWYTKNRVIVS